MLTQAREVAVAIGAAPGRRVPEAAIADLRRQMGGLLHRGFVAATGRRRLPDVVRYLRAMALPAGEAAGQRRPGRARGCGRSPRSTAEYEQLRAQVPATGAPDDPVARVRWMVEELRVGPVRPGDRHAAPGVRAAGLQGDRPAHRLRAPASREPPIWQGLTRFEQGGDALPGHAEHRGDPVDAHLLALQRRGLLAAPGVPALARDARTVLIRSTTSGRSSPLTISVHARPGPPLVAQRARDRGGRAPARAALARRPVRRRQSRPRARSARAAMRGVGASRSSVRRMGAASVAHDLLTEPRMQAAVTCNRVYTQQGLRAAVQAIVPVVCTRSAQRPAVRRPGGVAAGVRTTGRTERPCPRRSASIDLAPTAAERHSCPARWCWSCCAVWGAPHDHEDAALLVTELVANVVDHVRRRGGPDPGADAVRRRGCASRSRTARRSGRWSRSCRTERPRGRGLRMVRRSPTAGEPRTTRAASGSGSTCGPRGRLSRPLVCRRRDRGGVRRARPTDREPRDERASTAPRPPARASPTRRWSRPSPSRPTARPRTPTPPARTGTATRARRPPPTTAADRQTAHGGARAPSRCPDARPGGVAGARGPALRPARTSSAGACGTACRPSSSPQRPPR